MKRTLAVVLSLAGLWLASVSIVRADTLRVGVSLADLGNPFFYALAQHLQDAANDQSTLPVSMTVVSSAYDLQRQQAQIQQFIDDRVDIILLSAADSTGIEPSIHQARQAGITVTAVDIDAQGADLSVTTDNVQAGMVACRYLAERMGGTGDLGIINGASVSSVTDRVAGCRAVLQDYPDIRLVSDRFNAGGTFGGGLEAMTFLLSQHPAINGVFAINDPSALGAAEAATLAGRDDILITSVDGSDDLLAALASDHPNLIGTAAQSPEEMARRAIEVSLAHRENPLQSPQSIRIPTHMITRDSPTRLP
ncbi:substrate-binding domain-containing protein [Saccharospirillum impatiens]|uniref:substrate-binding domain-containing protein n=1 Tax=Saccharospirillum impatiens TaxID=169438 RepID=UPI00041C0EC4|nr:substrate-binding domain-containing protein [Saccharospirillum impatiens]